MPTQKARSPRDGSKINLQSLHARYNQVMQIVLCLRISIESEAEYIESASVCRAVFDMLEDINSDLWTFLEPALIQRIESKAGRDAAALRKRAHVSVDDLPGTSAEHHDPRGTDGLHHDSPGSTDGLHHDSPGGMNRLHHDSFGTNGLLHDPRGMNGLHHDSRGRNGDHENRAHDSIVTNIEISEDVAH